MLEKQCLQGQNSQLVLTNHIHMQGVGGVGGSIARAYLILGASPMIQSCRMLKVNTVGGWKRLTGMGFLGKNQCVPAMGFYDVLV